MSTSTRFITPIGLIILSLSGALAYHQSEATTVTTHTSTTGTTSSPSSGWDQTFGEDFCHSRQYTAVAVTIDGVDAPDMVDYFGEMTVIKTAEDVDPLDGFGFATNFVRLYPGGQP